MDNLVTLIPSLVKQIPAGIQALVFADKFILWDEYDCMMTVQESLFTHISIKSFLKLAFIKYTFGLTINETFENAADRESFQNYIACILSKKAQSEICSAFEHFTSPFGKIAELIDFIDSDLEKYGIMIERKKGNANFPLVPYLVGLSTATTKNPFLNQGVAVWL